MGLFSACLKTILIVLVVATVNSSYVKAEDTFTHHFNVENSLGKMPVEIHFEKVDLPFASRVKEILQTQMHSLFDYFDYLPKDTLHVVVKNRETRANGHAFVFPRNQINLNNYPPVGTEYLNVEDDWIRTLVIHELAHVLHMDQTSGFPQMVRSIFGAIGKWNGLVPFWFLEGVSTWAESNFATSGRLKNRLLEYEFKSIFSNENFCKTIDCLDDPGVYPGKSYRYWVGAYFVDFLEKRKPGTIRCLIKANSNSVPFFLNDAFDECLQEDIETAFAGFRKSMSASIDKSRESFRKTAISRKLKLVDLQLDDRSHVYWQRGLELNQSKFMFVEENRYVEELVSLDLTSGQKTKVALNDRMLDLSDTNLSFDTGRKEKKRVWKRVVSGKIEDVTIKRGAEYLLNQANGGLVLIRYEDNRWKIFKGDKLFFSFPELSGLVNPTIIQFDGKEQLGAKIFQNGKFHYKGLDLKSGKLTTYFSSAHPFDYLAVCNNTIILRQIDVLLVRAKEVEKSSAYWAKNLAALRFDQQQAVMLFSSDPSSVYYYANSCQDFLKNLASRKKVKKQKVVEKSSKKAIEEGSSHSYAPMAYFVPNYWFVMYQWGDVLDTITVNTVMSDPKNIHKLYFDLSYYPTITKAAPHVSYSYNIHEDLYAKASFSQEYTWSSIANRQNKDETKNVSISNIFSFKNWSYVPEVGASLGKERDFISTRDVIKYRFAQNLIYQGNLMDDIIERFDNYYQLYYQETKNSESFYAHRFKSELDLRWHYRFKTHLRFSHEKLNNKSLGSGLVYAGGNSGWGRTVFHSFLGLGRSDIYGNKITTGRGQLDLLVLDLHRGVGTSPLFFKKINLLAGVDYAKANWAYVDKQLLKDQELKAMHVGVRLTNTLFYFIPIELDLLYTSLFDYDEKGIVALFRGDFIP